MLMVAFSTNNHAENTPTSLLVQANVNIGDFVNYSGTLEMAIGIYEADIDDPPIWVETFERIYVRNGSFIATLGEGSVPLYAEIFKKENLRIGFTVYINNKSQGTEYISIKSVPYSFYSEISKRADRLTNEDILYFDFVNNRVGINNTSPQYTLDIVGTVNATNFIGDGSGITNVEVSDDRIVWLKGDPTTDIYYTSGNVGIGTESPSSRLDVNGNAIVSGNLVVADRITSQYLSGDGSAITSINADEITTGVLGNDFVQGAYIGITGVGQLAEGTWNATEIEDLYIADNLTLDGATIIGTNYISGNILLVDDTVITGDQLLTFETSEWSLDATGHLSLHSIAIDDLTISNNVIESSSASGISIKPTDYPGIFISPTGSIGIGTTSPATDLDIVGGLRVSTSDAEYDGVIRFQDNAFEGYRNNAWVRLDYTAEFDSHVLHGEGNAVQNVIYVNSDGNVGIGGIPSSEITDDLTVSGNVVFKGSTMLSDADLNVSGTGPRMIWYPKKSAFRAGYVDNDEWDDANIGYNSIVFGYSGLVDSDNSAIVGGKNNQILTASSTASDGSDGSVIVGGYTNSIQNSPYSTIIGGGSSTNQGNTIADSTYSTIIGGHSHSMSNSAYSTIVGGYSNTVNGEGSVAMGSQVTIAHDNTFVFSDGQQAVASTEDNQFLIFAEGGVGMGAVPSQDFGLVVAGGIKATYFEGDGSGLTGLTSVSSRSVNGYYPELVASPNSLYVSDSDGFLPANTVAGSSIYNRSIQYAHINSDVIAGEKIKNYTITSVDIADGAITAEKIADGAITASKIPDGSISSQNIADGGISSTNIAANSIYNHHIIDLAVTNEKIATNTIETSRIEDGSIYEIDLADDSISSRNIADNSILSQHIVDDAVVSDNISENAIQSQHMNDYIISSRNLADDSIYSDHIIDYSIQSEHIANYAIESIHIADDVITTERIVNQTITSIKIGDDMILSNHLPDDIVTSKHIADDTIQSWHIADTQIDGSKISPSTISGNHLIDYSITGDKITENAIESKHILDRTIQQGDLDFDIIPSELIAANSISSINIQNNSIASVNIIENSVTNYHIADYTIVSKDIKDGEIDGSSIGDGEITSDLIADNAIDSNHITDGAIYGEHIATNSITWDKITDSVSIPVSRIADNSIPGSALMDGSIDSDVIEDGSITSDKLAPNSIDSTNLTGVVPISNGGTGSSSFTGLTGSVLYIDEDSTTNEVFFNGNPNRLFWDHSTNRLGIGTDAPEESLHVVGNLWAEGGSILFGSNQNSITFSDDTSWLASEGYMVIAPNTDVLNSNDYPQGGLRARDLYVENKVGIGTLSPNNALDINGNVVIGSSYAGSMSAPSNGLLVEGSVGIATSNPNSNYQLTVDGGIYASGIFGEGDTIGVQGKGGVYGIQSNGSNTGVKTEGTNTGILAISNGIGSSAYGAHIVVENANTSAQGVLATLTNSTTGISVSASLGKIDTEFTAGVYATAPTNPNTTNWAAYFDGPVKLSGDLGIGLDENQIPSAQLHIKGDALIEASIAMVHHVTTNTTIAWHSSNKVSYDCSNGDSLTFTDPYSDSSLSSILTLTVRNCSKLYITSSTSIKWERGFAIDTYSLTDSSTYILSFYFDGDEYFGLEPVEFQ